MERDGWDGREGNFYLMQIINDSFDIMNHTAEGTLACRVKSNFAHRLEHTFLWVVLITCARPLIVPTRTNERFRFPACTNGHPAYCVV